jgi:hypothetical protein
MEWLTQYKSVWLVDFEFHAPAGERPRPLCMVARELSSGWTIRLGTEKLRALPTAPFPIGADALFVAYYASAELGCFLALNWPMPERILDLCVEFRWMTSGLSVTCGHGLLGALVYHGIDGIAAAEKSSMRELAMRGSAYSADERQQLLDYCETDVMALGKLLTAMLPKIDLPRALLRGRYMAAAGRMEWTGVPIDVETLATLRRNWSAVKDHLIRRVDSEFAVYDGATFKADRFAALLASRSIPWPRLDSGALALDDDTFHEMVRAYPELSPLRELRYALSHLRLESLAVGADGRNRCMLSAFGSKTGRNQPSTTKFIFGPSVWLRSLIKPEPSTALAYVDYEQQEFGIAAALSGDKAMQAAYLSGDPYLAFAKQAGAAPPSATKQSHPSQRALFKACILAVQYGMGAQSLAQRIDQPEVVARDLLRQHRETYAAYWRWSQAAVDFAMLRGQLHTVLGWRMNVGPNSNARSLANFPMQANGAEMLRLACCTATESGLSLCAPVHDAFLIEAPVSEIDAAVAAMESAMAEASEVVLGGFRLRTNLEATVFHPDRYMDDRGRQMWEIVMSILRHLEQSQPVP